MSAFSTFVSVYDRGVTLHTNKGEARNYERFGMVGKANNETCPLICCSSKAAMHQTVAVTASCRP